MATEYEDAAAMPWEASWQPADALVVDDDAVCADDPAHADECDRRAAAWAAAQDEEALPLPPRVGRRAMRGRAAVSP